MGATGRCLKTPKCSAKHNIFHVSHLNGPKMDGSARNIDPRDVRRNRQKRIVFIRMLGIQWGMITVLCDLTSCYLGGKDFSSCKIYFLLFTRRFRDYFYNIRNITIFNNFIVITVIKIINRDIVILKSNNYKNVKCLNIIIIFRKIYMYIQMSIRKICCSIKIFNKFFFIKNKIAYF